MFLQKQLVWINILCGLTSFQSDTHHYVFLQCYLTTNSYVFYEVANLYEFVRPTQCTQCFPYIDLFVAARHNIKTDRHK